MGPTRVVRGTDERAVGECDPEHRACVATLGWESVAVDRQALPVVGDEDRTLALEPVEDGRRPRLAERRDEHAADEQADDGADTEHTPRWSRPRSRRFVVVVGGLGVSFVPASLVPLVSPGVALAEPT